MQYGLLAVAALAGILLILIPLLPLPLAETADGAADPVADGAEAKLDEDRPPSSVVAVVPYARVDDTFLATWRARAAAACKLRQLWDDRCAAALPRWPRGEPRKPPWVREEGALAQDQALRLTVPSLRKSCPWLREVIVLAPRGQPLPRGIDARLVFHDEVDGGSAAVDHGPLPSFAPCSWAAMAALAAPSSDAVLVVPPTCVLRGAWTLWDFFTPRGRPVVHTRRRLVRGIVPVVVTGADDRVSAHAAARLPGDCRGDVMAALAVGAVHRVSTDGDGPLSRCVVEDVPLLRSDEPWASRYARAAERLLRRVERMRDAHGWV